MREPEGGCGLRPARIELSTDCPYVVLSAEVSKRCLVSNKPVKRTSKKVAGTSERGSSEVIGSDAKRPESITPRKGGGKPGRGGQRPRDRWKT